MVDEPTTKLAALTAGELDFAGIQPAHASFVARDPALAIVSYPLLQSYGIVFNTRHPPFDDLAVRRRVNAAVDRREIVEGYLYGFGTPAHGPVPPDLPGYVPVAADGRPTARQQVGDPLAFELLTVGSGEAPLEQMVQARLRAAGMRVTIRQLELSAFLARVYGREHDFDAAVLGVTGDPGLGYLGPLAARGGDDGARGSRGGTADVRGLAAGVISLSRARAAGNEPPGARGDDGSPGRAADGAAVVGRAVNGVVRFAAAPVRLDFAGGWTDVPPFSAREGGVVVSAAIGLSAQRRGSAGGRGAPAGGGGPRRGGSSWPTRASCTPTGPLALLQAGLRLLPVGPCTLTTRSDTPPGSGLGSSGALDVALVAALAAARGERLDRREVADLACRLERVEAGIAGGRQDQFTAAFGGFVRIGLPRSVGATVRAARARSGCSGGARAAHGAVLHRCVALLGQHDRAG